ncbi:GGDEF domain-containing protein [Trichocoleus desertorum AS-A10]|uniref:diguanylate cyclase n=1 Tax=Trichocoleus desertorum TaxID=1481672 RepID=UPI00329A5374
MKWSIEKSITGGFGIALLVLSLIGGLGYHNITQLVATANWVNHTYRVLEAQEVLLFHIANAEAGQRGYVITGQEEYLEPYYISTNTINDQVDTLQRLTADNPRQQQRLNTLRPLLQQRLDKLQAVLDTRQEQGFTAAQQAIREARGRQVMDAIRRLMDEMTTEENRLLQQRSHQAELATRNTTLVVAISGFLAAALLPIAAITLNRDIRRRKTVELALQESETKLKGWVGELEQRSREIALLGELSDVLQACFTLGEAYAVVAELVQPLFPGISGAIYITSESRNLVEAIASWGPLSLQPIMFDPTDCWALRRGRAYFIDNGDSSLRCQHLQAPWPTQYCCIPLMAQGDALGTLYLAASNKDDFTPTKRLLTGTVAEHIALAFANLKLRESLRNQSIRDPLTNLFNRRYMEESLEREVRRAERNRQPLGIVMLDIDHFKRFNDTFGHEAGDAVLREVGLLIRNSIRASDIACRYGGEELMLLLPDASLEATRQRAEHIREAVSHLSVHYHRQALGMITLSAGVASYPLHGPTGEAVTRMADTALYRAKAAGRDRVMVADETLVASSASPDAE